MIIECPYCETRFRLDERSLGGKRPTLRCSQCQRTFPLPGEPPIAGDPDDLSFDDDDPGGLPDSAPPTSDDDRQFSLPNDRDSQGDDEPQHSLFGETPSTAATEEDDRWFGETTDQPSEAAGNFDPFAEDPTDEVGPTPTEFDTDYDDNQEEDVKRGIQTTPVLVFLTLLVLGYGVLASTLKSNPGWTTGIVSQLPLIGDADGTSALRERVELLDLRGRYERTKEGKLIFVVTGKAANQHDEALRGIRIRFKLLDQEGAVIADQSATCGNAMRVELVRDLTIQQVAILRGWGPQPPSETKIRPGEDCPLVGIFLNVPETITDYTAEVLQARVS